MYHLFSSEMKYILHTANYIIIVFILWGIRNYMHNKKNKSNDKF